MTDQRTARRPAHGLLTAAVLAALAVTGVAVPQGTADAAETFTLEGRGNGHGIGLSQYGAQGQAKAGRDHHQIIETYYQGARVANRANDTEVRVGVGDDQRRVRMFIRGADATLRFSDGTRITSQPGDRWTITPTADGGCSITRGTEPEKEGPCPVLDPHPGGRIQPALEAPDGKYSYHHEYGWSARVFVLPDKLGPDDHRFDVVVRTPVEEYLYGLAEMPYSWEPAALRAQAIAGRSYARRIMANGLRGDCSCHLFDDQRSQVYAGMDRALDTATSSYWEAKWRPAVDGTADDVVTYDDRIIPTFYSSSSNGRTESRHELWGGSPIPYLMSVADPWAFRDDVHNPHRWWQVGIADTAMASRLGLDDIDVVRVAARSTSGAATEVVFDGQKDGRDVRTTKSGNWVRFALGLRSTTIDKVFLPPFTDDDGNIHETAIIWLADAGITAGCNPPTNDRYCPDGDVTRGEMAAFLTRALDLPAGSANFTDTSGSTFERDIAALAEAGITRGCNPPDNSRYCPRAPVTRAQMATFLQRALDLPAGTAGTFDDVPAGSTHEHGIAALAEAGITRGCNPPANDRYCPSDPVTRAEMATFLQRGLHP